ncbi:Methyltransferase domain-containing protein [Geodermatophilus amargosae]|uniref:Methyltransferase domain-containing protein n=1 Tax=Geodermatophilus amargosae TaxID=1296565 RepID=A0A1I7CW53_9ACTN|nr:class I SAM-dependent methyltransferase [Geodermatophilus amargosae]SFU03653.1 Methyltransferase domain-containing protein [Geodermatophilus amargosae]
MSIAKDPDDPALGGNMIGGDPQTFHPALWDYLIDRFSLTSLLDVGCGEGHCLLYCAEQGLRVKGLDGLRGNLRRAVAPITLHDLRSGPFHWPADLVHCCEVVEHIDERYVGNVLRTLANGRVIAMTHAVPGQTGYHHVNCQPAGYWIDKVTALGYAYRPQETEEGKAAIRTSGAWTYFMASGLVFERVDGAAQPGPVQRRLQRAVHAVQRGVQRHRR